MKEFDTFEKVQNLFRKLNLDGENNNYFIAYKDIPKQVGLVGGAVGGMVQGMAHGMEYPFDAVLINNTEKGIAMILLTVEGITWNFVKLEKLHVKDNEFIFIKNEDIENITIKKFALLNSTKKKIIIKTKNKKVYSLYANINEPLLPYHNENFNEFIKKYEKK